MLYWLLSEEMVEGTAALEQQDYAKANAAFGKAERIDARFGAMCFLHALTLFRMFEMAMQNEPDFDTITGHLTSASTLLETAVNDRVVRQQSRNLKNAVDSYLKELQKVGSQRQALKKESEAINGLFSLFNNSMEYYNSHPISNRSELESARKIMKGIKDEIVKLKKKHQNNSETVQALARLEEAVNNVLRQLG